MTFQFIIEYFDPKDENCFFEAPSKEGSCANRRRGR